MFGEEGFALIRRGKVTAKMNPRSSSYNPESESAAAIGRELQREHSDTDSATAVEEPAADTQTTPGALRRAERGFQASFYHTGFNAPVAYESATLAVPAKVAADQRPTDSNLGHWPSRSRQNYNLIMDNIFPSMKTD